MVGSCPAADPAGQPLLLVYFSGHLDARALHVVDSELELKELEQLVRGSAAVASCFGALRLIDT